jgi:hypothetical protein
MTRGPIGSRELRDPGIAPEFGDFLVEVKATTPSPQVQNGI